MQFSHLGLFFSSFDLPFLFPLPFEAIIAESFDCSLRFFSAYNVLASLMIALTSALRAMVFPIVQAAALITVSNEQKIGVREVRIYVANCSSEISYPISARRSRISNMVPT